MRWSVDPWDPAYGAAVEVDELAATTASVNAEVEVPAAGWRALSPGDDAAVLETVLFVDGVRRVEARVWIEDGDGGAEPGITASYAAGVVCCNGAARVSDVEVGRGLFSSSPLAAAVETACGSFPARMAASSSPEALSLALQERMTAAEAAVAERAGGAAEADLIVIDGPLRGRQHLVGAVGYVKTHHVAYLPSEQHALVARLEPGQRTPLFTLQSAWSRQSWYVRLPGLVGSPWAGVVRCECSADLPVEDAARLADATAAILPRFASQTHKDPRAPQNLHPIAGLERELRRRLGDQALIYRALRRAASRTAA